MIRPDCTYHPGFIADPATLFAVVRDEVPWTDQMVSRRTASMGWPYNYRGASYPVAEWHPAVQAVRERVAAAVGFMPSNCLMNYYPTGRHGLGWHSDDVDILEPGTGIAIVSLGVTRPLRLRRHGQDGYIYESMDLAPGSLLHMSAAMQAIWQHSLRRAATEEARISLTFRHIIRDSAAPPLRY